VHHCSRKSPYEHVASSNFGFFLRRFVSLRPGSRYSDFLILRILITSREKSWTIHLYHKPASHRLISLDRRPQALQRPPKVKRHTFLMLPSKERLEAFSINRTDLLSLQFDIMLTIVTGRLRQLRQAEASGNQSEVKEVGSDIVGPSLFCLQDLISPPNPPSRPPRTRVGRNPVGSAFLDDRFGREDGFE
jgi:hypothetical protein